MDFFLGNLITIFIYICMIFLKEKMIKWPVLFF